MPNWSACGWEWAVWALPSGIGSVPYTGIAAWAGRFWLSCTGSAEWILLRGHGSGCLAKWAWRSGLGCMGSAKLGLAVWALFCDLDCGSSAGWALLCGLGFLCAAVWNYLLGLSWMGLAALAWLLGLGSWAWLDELSRMRSSAWDLHHGLWLAGLGCMGTAWAWLGVGLILWAWLCGLG
jgi:hypothetical protein